MRNYKSTPKGFKEEKRDMYKWSIKKFWLKLSPPQTALTRLILGGLDPTFTDNYASTIVKIVADWINCKNPLEKFERKLKDNNVELWHENSIPWFDRAVNLVKERLSKLI